jgi:16S rRNA (uracil1498-N3)-methyltransferase
MSDKPRTRLFVSDDLAAGAAVTVGRDRAHYLAHVLRLAVGAPVALLNGRDGEWLARIESIAKNRALLAVESQQREQGPEPDLWLVFAPVKRAPLDFLVQKATELGVSALLPAVTRRTVVERVKRDRMVANATEAAEQSERLTVPRVEEAAPLSQIVENWPVGRPLLVCAETGETAPIVEILARQDPAAPAAILTGPEGGFDQSELDALRKLPFVTAVGLGPRILRADTAAIAALACWQAALGDWRKRPPGRD